MEKLLEETFRPALPCGEKFATGSSDVSTDSDRFDACPFAKPPETTDELLYAIHPRKDHATKKVF
jgi:hypothetical protein